MRCVHGEFFDYGRMPRVRASIPHPTDIDMIRMTWFDWTVLFILLVVLAGAEQAQEAPASTLPTALPTVATAAQDLAAFPFAQRNWIAP